METALSTVGILDEYGEPKLGEFYVLSDTEGNPEEAAIARMEQEDAQRAVRYCSVCGSPQHQIPSG